MCVCACVFSDINKIHDDVMCVCVCLVILTRSMRVSGTSLLSSYNGLQHSLPDLPLGSLVTGG